MSEAYLNNSFIEVYGDCLITYYSYFYPRYDDNERWSVLPQKLHVKRESLVDMTT